MNQSTKQKWFYFFIFSFVLLRVPGLFRELAFEESTYLMPGRNLLLGQGFNFNFGILSPHTLTFHKPPLASLLPGIFSFLSQDLVVGARFFPFLIGFFICALPYWLTGSILISFLALLLPFLHSASAHLQTDPTVGLLGYGLLVAALYRFYEDRYTPFKRLLWAGLFILWLGKLELAFLASVSLAVYGLLIEKNQRKVFWLSFAKASLSGVISFIGLTWFLGWLDGISFSRSVMAVIQTVLGISQGVLHLQTHSETQAARYRILQDLHANRVLELFVLTWVPIGIALLKLKEFKSHAEVSFKLYTALFFLSILPAIVYGLGGYQGDGFPRYFLAVVPGTLVALGHWVKTLPRNFYKPYTAMLILSLLLVFLPKTLERYHTSTGITGTWWVHGARDAAKVMAAFTKKNDLIYLSTDQPIPYLPERRFILVATVSAQTIDVLIQQYANQIRAALINPEPESLFTKKLLSALRLKGAIEVPVGTYRVLVLPQ